MGNVYIHNNDIDSILMLGTNSNQILQISFVIPTYLRSDTILDSIRSIESLKGLSSISYEIIVVDNSADFSDENKTLEIIKGENINNLRYFINEKNLGMEGNWNRGFELANGELVSYLHDDDLLSADYLENVLLCMNEAKAKAKNRFGFLKVRHRTFSSNKPFPKLSHSVRLIYEFTILEALISGASATSTPSCGIIFSKKALIEVGGFNPDYFPIADAEIGLRMLKAGYRGYRTHSELGYYRIGINESMKISTLKLFVEKKIGFRNDIYIYKWYCKLFGAIFEQTFYTDSINFWIRYVKEKFNLAISIAELDCLQSYKVHPFKRKILSFIYRVYRKVTLKEAL